MRGWEGVRESGIEDECLGPEMRGGTAGGLVEGAEGGGCERLAVVVLGSGLSALAYCGPRSSSWTWSRDTKGSVTRVSRI